MVTRVNPRPFAIEYQVVSDDGVGGRLNAIVRRVEDEVALDYARRFSIRVVDNDPGILHAVDDIVADEVSPASIFEFDASPG